MDTEDLQQKLAAVLAQQLGCTVTISELVKLTGGAAAQTWRFNAAFAEKCLPLVMRLAHDGEQFDGALDKKSEALVQGAAVESGVPAANILAVLEPAAGLGEGYIMAYIEGETIPQKILGQSRFQVARSNMAKQCGEILATIHAVPLSDVSLLPQYSVPQQIQRLKNNFLSYGEQLPVFHYAFKWLEERMPADADSCLVHGDFRHGNLIVNEQGIAAILDWEMAHIGNPMEDLGWLCVNSWRFGRSDLPVGGFGIREDLYAAYEKKSGRAVSPDVVTFWELYGVLKWGIICLYQTHVHLIGKERSVERAAIGRRVSECELDIMDLIAA